METVRSGDTVGNARRALARALRDAGLDSPDLDARLLLQHALCLDHSALALAADRPLDAHEARRISALATRRLQHEPIALIVGEKEFWGLPLRVTAATLVPRPDTETLVEAALSLIDRHGARARPLRIADLGTGTGAILLALLSELPNGLGIGTDLSREAAAVARENAQHLGLAQRAAFVVGDFGQPLASGFDLVVSNPPYIAQAEIDSLSPDVCSYEPRGALDGGPDGLDAYRAIAADAWRLLAPGGHLIVELGQGQEEAATNIFLSMGLISAGPARSDLAGVPRALILARRGGD